VLKSGIKITLNNIKLTKREQKILKLMCENKTQQYIAQELNISQPRVNKIIKKIRTKAIKYLH
jgi:RNA polymerase sigma factor (sigma-70 family)